MELMSQFISMTPDTILPQQFNVTPTSEPLAAVSSSSTPVPSSEGLFLTHKQMALKVLALKVATWLKWNLDVLEKNLPIPKQLFLLRDLCTLSFGKKVGIPLSADFQMKISKYDF